MCFAESTALNLCLDTKNSDFLNPDTLGILSEIVDLMRQIFSALCIRNLVVLAFSALKILARHIYNNYIEFYTFLVLCWFASFGK